MKQDTKSVVVCDGIRLVGSTNANASHHGAIRELISKLWDENVAAEEYSSFPEQALLWRGLRHSIHVGDPKRTALKRSGPWVWATPVVTKPPPSQILQLLCSTDTIYRTRHSIQKVFIDRMAECKMLNFILNGKTYSCNLLFRNDDGNVESDDGESERAKETKWNVSIHCRHLISFHITSWRRSLCHSDRLRWLTSLWQTS